LTAEKRESIFKAIKDEKNVGYCAEIISAEKISNLMLSKHKTSLNAIAFDSTCSIINEVLSAGINVKQVFVDTVGDADKHRQRLESIFGTSNGGIEFKVCPKADSLFPVVSAASIVAKVIRDETMQAISNDFFGFRPNLEDNAGKEESEQAITLKPAPLAAFFRSKSDIKSLGTGYPADPDTKKFMSEFAHPVVGFPSFVRFSWETCSRILTEKAISMEFEADSEGPSSAANIPGTIKQPAQQRLQFKAVNPPSSTAISGFSVLGRTGVKRRSTTEVIVETSGIGRHAFFKARKIQRVSEPF